MNIFTNFKLQIFRGLKELSDDVQRFDLEWFFQGQISKNQNDQNFQLLITLYLLNIFTNFKLQIFRVLKDFSDDVQRFDLEWFFQGQIGKNRNDQNFQLLITLELLNIFTHFKLQIFRVLNGLSDDIQIFDLEWFFQGHISKNRNDQNFQSLITL